MSVGKCFPGLVNNLRAQNSILIILERLFVKAAVFSEQILKVEVQHWQTGLFQSRTTLFVENIHIVITVALTLMHLSSIEGSIK